jgi:tetratricopeptide (TPR) repeat protein
MLLFTGEFIMKRVICFRTYVFLITLMAAVSGCSDNSDNTTNNYDIANQLMEAAYQDFQNGNNSQALAEVNSSIGIAPIRDAYLLKAQIEYRLGDQAAANNTLFEFNRLYPSDGGDDFLNAMLLSENQGNANQILRDLLIALHENYAGLGCELYWNIIENDDTFNYFRQQSQYQTLEALKTCTTGNVESLGKCREDETKVDHHWWGLQLYLAQSDTEAVGDVGHVADLCRCLFGDVTGALVALVMEARSAEIKARNKGCGVILNWTWLNFNPPCGVPCLDLYWVTIQD